MGNCLVTKLKSVVDNDNLRKLNVLRFRRVSDANIGVNMELNLAELTGTSEEQVKIVVSGDCRLTKAGHTYQNETIYLAAKSLNGIAVEGTEDGGYVEVTFVPVMYNNRVNGLIKNASVNVDIQSLALMSNTFIAYMITSKNKFVGTPKLSEWLELAYTNRNNIASQVTDVWNLNGNWDMDLNNCVLSHFGPFISLKRISKVNTLEESDAEAIGAAQVSAGRTSGTLTITGNNVYYIITFDSSVPNGYTISSGQ